MCHPGIVMRPTAVLVASVDSRNFHSRPGALLTPAHTCPHLPYNGVQHATRTEGQVHASAKFGIEIGKEGKLGCHVAAQIWARTIFPRDISESLDFETHTRPSGNVMIGPVRKGL